MNHKSPTYDRLKACLSAIVSLTDSLLDFIEDEPWDGNSARQELLEETRAVIAKIKEEMA